MELVSISAEKVTVMLAVRETLVALSAGVVPVTSGFRSRFRENGLL
jgi:hypothetical protein